jgi:hypothetical protein
LIKRVRFALLLEAGFFRRRIRVSEKGSNYLHIPARVAFRNLWQGWRLSIRLDLESDTLDNLGSRLSRINNRRRSISNAEVTGQAMQPQPPEAELARS